ncbi:hypothetical protein GQ600_23315 [Phytophthora cactorum]|nr:hypothetical protein GQ600_23315 [Phytophthora cactorum]
MSLAFKVEFETNVVVLFENGNMITENFPITLYRTCMTVPSLLLVALVGATITCFDPRNDFTLLETLVVVAQTPIGLAQHTFSYFWSDKLSVSGRLLVALEDLAHKQDEHLRRHDRHLRDLVRKRLVRLVLVAVVNRLQIKLNVELLDDCNSIGVIAAVVLLQRLPLLRRRTVKRLDDQPAALVVLNVRPHFADHLLVAVAVKVIVLDLEVLANLHADLLREVVRSLVDDSI